MLMQADQPGLRASMARPKQVPRMLASISEDRVTGAIAFDRLPDVASSQEEAIYYVCAIPTASAFTAECVAC